MKRPRFYHGLKLTKFFFCPYCDRKCDGVVVRELFRWRKKLECGHVISSSGYVLPPEELERLGYVNEDFGEDPRTTLRKAQMLYDMLQEAKEQRERALLKEIGKDSFKYRPRSVRS